MQCSISESRTFICGFEGKNPCLIQRKTARVLKVGYPTRNPAMEHYSVRRNVKKIDVLSFNAIFHERWDNLGNLHLDIPKV